MKQSHRRLLLASLLASLGFATLAQTPPAPEGGPGQPAPQARHERRGWHDPARMQERMARRLAELKDKLQIAPAQEGAWTAFTTALKPPATRPARPDRAEFEKLTTPERIDRLQALHAQRDAELRQRAEATKAFYATLSLEQQKVFDAEFLRFLSRARHGRHHGGLPG